ncbi:Uncharacterised protein [uncultured archaeon]|nr:Uncharacterised protein [uncultured archaeon]
MNNSYELSSDGARNGFRTPRETKQEKVRNTFEDCIASEFNRPLNVATRFGF